jgi:hypothetical protein
MTALEARFSGLEGRIPAIAAGLNNHELGILRVNEKLLDHDGRFDATDRRLDGIEATLAAILAKLSGPEAAPGRCEWLCVVAVGARDFGVMQQSMLTPNVSAADFIRCVILREPCDGSAPLAGPVAQMPSPTSVRARLRRPNGRG